MSNWSKPYFIDLAERVGSTAIYGAITMLTSNEVVGLDWQAAWVVIGLPTVLSLLKGVLANLADSESGASIVPAPPGPEVQPDADLEPDVWVGEEHDEPQP